MLGPVMHRLSSKFADRLPNNGLLLLRLLVVAALISRCIRLEGIAPLHMIAPHVIAAGVGLFLLVGLWTPVAGVIVAITEVLIAFSPGHDPSLSLLLAGLGIAVALLGPGSRSVDARLSGWKRIEIRHPEN
jgi:uncharacterized membrane protein YphA (DoxX/SURF4 family)